MEIAHINPTISLALTKQATPRVLLMAKGEGSDKKNIVFFECDQQCLEGDRWRGSIVSDHDRLRSGLDLALDANDKPRFVYTLDYNIVLAHCDGAECAGEQSSWDLTLVERATDLPPDQIFLWDNCTVGAWVMHDPSLALTASGAPRVGYQIRDISGGFSQPDPTKPGCSAGTDMTWSRITALASYK